MAEFLSRMWIISHNKQLSKISSKSEKGDSKIYFFWLFGLELLSSTFSTFYPLIINFGYDLKQQKSNLNNLTSSKTEFVNGFVKLCRRNRWFVLIPSDINRLTSFNHQTDLIPPPSRRDSDLFRLPTITIFPAQSRRRKTHQVLFSIWLPILLTAQQ